MLNLFESMTKRIGNIIAIGAKSKMSDLEFLEKEIQAWKCSRQRALQIKGQLYYQNEHDILKRKRTMIGADGKLEEVANLPNNRIIDNQYAKIVNQKANYLFGKPFILEGKNEAYLELLKSLFNKRFMRLLKNAGKQALNGGIAWIYVYYNAVGELAFKIFQSYEVLPFWKDSEHTELDFAVRLYEVCGYEGTNATIVEKVEVYRADGVQYYVFDGTKLIPDVEGGTSNEGYINIVDDEGNKEVFNWSRIPLIPIKYNEQEIPLLKRVKSLQDGINIMLSDFENNMQEDARNTILVLKNYDGTNLGEFRKNLATYGAVKVRYDGETKGGVETLEVHVNADNYKSILDIFKKALIENAMGYDAKDDRLSGNANQMNIQSMYSDIDLDANDMESEVQASLEELLWFINVHLANTGQGNFENEDVNIIFNRDILINESEAIANCVSSVGLLSDETIIGQHPWIDNPQLEIERLEKQKQKQQEEMAAQYEPFQTQNQDDKGGGVDATER